MHIEFRQRLVLHDGALRPRHGADQPRQRRRHLQDHVDRLCDIPSAVLRGAQGRDQRGEAAELQHVAKTLLAVQQDGAARQRRLAQP